MSRRSREATPTPTRQAAPPPLAPPPLAPPPLVPAVTGVIAQLARRGGAVSEQPLSELALLAERVQFAAGGPLAERTALALELGQLERDDVTLAWELARLVEAPAQTTALAVVLDILEAAQRGSTRMRLTEASGEATRGPSEAPPEGQLELPFAVAAPAEALAAPGLSPMCGPYDEGRPVVREHGSVALRRWAATERAIARDLTTRRGATPEAAQLGAAEAQVQSLREAPGALRLTAEQEAAVTAMLTERTVVLTGGPGTGKTSVVVSLLRALARRAAAEGTDAEGGAARLAEVLRGVALAAPTGKAADRLGEAVRTALSGSEAPLDVALREGFAPPTTIHRLLGYRPGARGGEGSFRAHRHNQLAQQLVLIDEVSMIDTVLFERLLAAVAPEATLVLLGDPDQLPSVDPGAVLRDLLEACAPGLAVHALTKSHRMDPSDPDGAHVLSVARACLAEGAGAVAHFHRPPGALNDVVGRGGAWHVEATALPQVLDAWVTRHLLRESLGALDAIALPAPDTTPAAVLEALEQLGRARILTVTRRSAEEIDSYVSAAFARWRGEPTRGRRVMPGEPVMVVRNDYDEDLWNGDSGIAWRDVRGETFVSFRRGTGVRTRPLAAVSHLVERSHAVTVHKAQGSEHEEVLLVLPATDTALSSREIVYTAITRARRSAIVVGRGALLASALGRASRRETGLGDALRDAARANGG